MAFCSKCGAQLNPGAAFCPSCGTPVGGAAPGSSPPAAAGTAMTSNVAALLTYVLGFITGIIFLVIEPYKNDRFVRFHAFQSIFYSALLVAFSIAWRILEAMVFTVTLGALWGLLALIYWVVRLAFFAGWILLMYKAYNNERFMLPVIGEMAAKQAG
ncbi:MAG TPA: zinc-ribbon domain-containing protein [Terriglobia bacterium]|nr:zinc-ribbon domain-containing protein [Terriglobia bacterium]